MQFDSNHDHRRELVFLNPVGGKSLGGGEMVAVDVLAALADRGWKILLVAPGDSVLPQDLRLQDKVEFLPLDLDTDRSGCWDMIGVVWKVIGLSRQRSKALWYGNTYRSLKWLALAKLAGDVRNLCHLHESYYQPYYQLRTRWLAAHVDSFICISEAVRREILRGTQRPGLTTVTVYNGLQPGQSAPKTKEEKHDLRRELRLPERAALVCLPARSDPLKGHEVLLSAAAKLVGLDKDIHFIIIGGNWNTEGSTVFETRIRTQLQELGLAANVTLLPHTSRVRDYMRCADLVVVPSLSEGFGRVAVEAMMEQTAVVASAVGGLVEIIRHGQDGLLVEAGDAEGLAQAIQKMLTDERLRTQCVTSAFARSLALFSHQNMVDRIESELLATGQPLRSA